MLITAAIILIGDEILSGRTQDKNVQHIANKLALIGIRLLEVRIIGDDIDVISQTVNALRKQYSYVFTTGGIGATHDDITTDAIAKAFGCNVIINEHAYKILEAYYAHKQIDFNETRQRMARIPEGAQLIANSVSAAPGYYLDNVYIMAGIPSIMQAMLENVLPTLRQGSFVYSETLYVPIGEGEIAEALASYQIKFPNISIGSYPFFENHGGFGVNIVLRSENKIILGIAKKEIQEYLMGRHEQ